MIQDPFRSMIRSEGVLRYRDLPWRRTRDPYIIWLSEVMLQQTQVPRVETRMPAWLDRFPTVQALAQAAPSDVLDAWQGMGYNRRALALHRAAQCVVADWGGEFPRETRDLVALPGIGPATAQGIRSFAFDLPGVYLETNVRTVFLHHFFSRCAGRSRSRAGAADPSRLSGGSRCDGGRDCSLCRASRRCRHAARVVLRAAGLRRVS